MWSEWAHFQLVYNKPQQKLNILVMYFPNGSAIQISIAHKLRKHISSVKDMLRILLQ